MSTIAEVMDKLPTTLEIWFLGFVLGLAGFYVWQLSRILGALLLGLQSLLAWGLLIASKPPPGESEDHIQWVVEARKLLLETE